MNSFTPKSFTIGLIEQTKLNLIRKIEMSDFSESDKLGFIAEVTRVSNLLVDDVNHDKFDLIDPIKIPDSGISRCSKCGKYVWGRHCTCNQSVETGKYDD